MFVASELISLLRPLVDRFPRIATMYRRMRDELDCMEEPKPTPWGFKLAGNASMAQGTFEPTETELVRNILKDVDILVNVGANVGYYCCHALSMGKPVIAFEPIQRNLGYLYRNIKANGWSNIEVYPLALSSSVGVLEIYGGDTGASVVKGWAGIPEHYATLVPTSTLNVVLGTRLRGKRALIIIDVEGAEQQVLEGATITLANEPKPVWIVEIVTADHWPGSEVMNPNLESTFASFFRSGYQAFTVDREICPVTIEHVKLASNNRRQLPSHNFMFSESKVILR